MRPPRDPRIRQIGSGVVKRLFGERWFAKLRAELIMTEEYERLCQIRIDTLVYVNQPLVLISQIQRSGGTLLSQLFDGHPQCHAHPYELKVGYPDKSLWPVLDLRGNADDWFRILFEPNALKSFKKGYKKDGREGYTKRVMYPFILPSVLQKAIFDKCISSRQVESQRDVFDCYMTSYFNAWLDNQNLYGPSKKLITAFTPRLGMREDNLERFFATYPDGWLVCIIREPKSWYVSARQHSQALYGDIGQAMRLWTISARSMIEAKERYSSRVYIMSFEDLLGATETTMRSLAGYLGIDFVPCLLSPTFNRLPMKADSSFRMNGYGVLKDPLFRYQGILTAEEMDHIDRQALELYQQVIQRKDNLVG